MNKISTINYNILMEAWDMLKDIPESGWITEFFTDGVSRCCAVGHYQRLSSGRPNDYSKYNCHDILAEDGPKASRLRRASIRLGIDISRINNGPSKYYPQLTPKQRVMAFFAECSLF